MKIKILVIILVGLFVFQACPGCGDEVAVNTAPTAGAGIVQDVNTNTTVTLDGSASADPDGDALTYAWTQTSGMTTVTLDDAAAVQPQFTAPVIPDTLVFQLIVNDGTVDSDPATVTIKVWTDIDNRLFVNASASADTGVCSQANPCTMITDAINASSGADVYVAGGTYSENITMVEGVSIFGGYESTNWTRDISTNTTTISPSLTDAPTIVVGSGLTASTYIDGFTITGPAYTNSLTPAYTLDLWGWGVLTISNNTISGGSHTSNGVHTISCTSGGDGPVISDNTITTGSTTGTDTMYRVIAVDIHECTNVTISGNTVSGSSDPSYSAAGGVKLINVEEDSSVTIQSNTIDAGNNSSRTDTGDGTTVGITINNSASATISRNRIDGGNGLSSEARGSAGIVSRSSGSVTIENNIIYAGNGYPTGGAFDNDSIVVSGAGANIVNNTIYLGGSAASGTKKGINNQSAGNAINVVNNLIIQNGVGRQSSLYLDTVQNAQPFASVYNNVFVSEGEPLYDSGGPPPLLSISQLTEALNAVGTANGGNLSGDPLFEEGSDYLLQAGSPCVGAGCSEGSACGNVTLPTVDYDGDARPTAETGLYDIGADQYQGDSP